MDATSLEEGVGNITTKIANNNTPIWIVVQMPLFQFSVGPEDPNNIYKMHGSILKYIQCKEYQTVFVKKI